MCRLRIFSSEMCTPDRFISIARRLRQGWRRLLKRFRFRITFRICSRKKLLRKYSGLNLHRFVQKMFRLRFFSSEKCTPARLISRSRRVRQGGRRLLKNIDITF